MKKILTFATNVLVAIGKAVKILLQFCKILKKKPLTNINKDLKNKE